MFSNAHFDRVRRTFADQFEPDGDSFLYRKSTKGAPIRESAAERAVFVAAFNRRLRYAAWSIVPATLALIGILVWLIPNADSTVGSIAVYAGLALLLAPFLMIIYWALEFPSA